MATRTYKLSVRVNYDDQKCKESDLPGLIDDMMAAALDSFPLVEHGIFSIRVPELRKPARGR